MCEAYNGWTNRETWALNLYLSNDQGLDEMVRERVADALDSTPLPEWATEPDEIKHQLARIAGETVKALWDEITDPSEELMSAENILSMVRDVGSEYRVDWDEIGAAWLSDVEEG